MKRTAKLRLTRPSDAFIPAALAACCLLRRGEPAAELYAFQLLVKLLGLAAPEGLRIAFAIQPSLRRARGSVRAALGLQFIGALIAAAGCLFIPDATLRVRCLMLTAAGFLVNAEQVFYETLFCVGDGGSAVMCRAITAALLTAGVLMSAPARSGGAMPVWICGAALLAALVAGTVARLIGGGMKGRPNAQVVRCAPRAMLRAALYPAAALAVGYLLPSEAARPPFCADFPFFAGLAVLSLCRAPFRRSGAESRIMNRALAAVCVVGLAMLSPLLLAHIAAPAVANALAALPALMPRLGAMLLLSALCAFALYGHIK